MDFQIEVKKRKYISGGESTEYHVFIKKPESKITTALSPGSTPAEAIINSIEFICKAFQDPTNKFYYKIKRNGPHMNGELIWYNNQDGIDWIITDIQLLKALSKELYTINHKPNHQDNE